MLERPDYPDENIIACVQDQYGLKVAGLAFLPLGADLNTAVYQIIAEDKTAYFLKLRSGVFDDICVVLPKFLSDQGIVQIIAPLETKTGQLWAQRDGFKSIVYPFVEGLDIYEVDLSQTQWVEFGAALRRIHSLELPSTLRSRIKRETYSPRWRETVKQSLRHVERETFENPVAVKMAALLHTKRVEILELVGRADRLVRELQARSLELILCHSDLHAGNLLVTAAGALYMVDWDDPILAPRERDLMYIGGGLLGGWHLPEEEQTLFYRGYGQTEIDPVALAYYRYERIIQDIAVYCEQILLTTGGGEDREQSFEYLRSNFLPGHTIEIANMADRMAV